MKSLTLIRLVVVIGLLSIANPAYTTALLVQTNDIWTSHVGTIQPYTALTNAGIPFTRISHSAFSTTTLSGYDFLYLVGQDGEDSNYINYIIPNLNKVRDYVNSGGLALIHFADWQLGGALTIGPLGVRRIRHYTNTGNIPPGKETDPLFNGLTDADLDNWGNTAHGYLFGLPAEADILVVNEYNRPIYARYPIGLGQVWITTMTLEWGGANHTFLYNELNLAKPVTPIPEPTTIFLLGSGLIGFGLVNRLKRKNN